MSLKSIDAQLSLSRTMEAGSVQNQLTHKPSDDQTAIAAQSLKQSEMERMRSNQVDKSAESRIRDGSRQGGRYRKTNGKTQEEKSEEEAGKSDHPYKGKFIDLSL